MNKLKFSLDLYCKELSNKNHIPIHPIVLLGLLELSWEKVSRYQFFYKTDDYIINAEYDFNNNEFTFNRVYNGSVSNITERIIHKN